MTRERPLLRGRPLIPLVSVVLVLAAAGNAAAWNRQGHMVTAAIAYQELQQFDPAALRAVIDLLEQHPHFADLLTPPGGWNLDDEERDQAIFMRAARWADDIRSGRYESYSRPTWHYVNYRYSPPDLVAPRARGDGDLLTALSRNREQLATGTRAVDRALALTWLFHLVGDIHQPLHSIALTTDRYPEGDRGGNLFYVRVRRGDDTINLHQLWDGLVFGNERFREVRNRAIEMRRNAAAVMAGWRTRLGDGGGDAWAAEAARAATRHVYLDGGLRGGARESGALLPAGYIDAVRPVAERRALLAGHRLARLLQASFSQAQAQGQGQGQPQVHPGRPVTLDSLRFMAGCWEGSFGSGGTLSEQYTVPTENIMLGTSRFIRGDRAVEYKFTRIQADADGIALTPYPNGTQSPDAFRLTSLVDHRAVFEAPQHDFPKRIIYAARGDGGIVAQVDAGANDPSPRTWQLRSVPCDRQH